jgi:hypothetical protein
MPPQAREDVVEQELVVATVEHEGRRCQRDRVAGRRAGARSPVRGEHRRERLDLHAQLVRGRSVEGHLPPAQLRGPLGVAREEHRCVGVGEVRDDEHGVRVLDEAIGHLLETEAYVLEADLLRDREHGNVGKRWCTVRSTRERTVPSPIPASKRLRAGGVGSRNASSSAHRAAMRVFSLHVVTKARYFWRLS